MRYPASEKLEIIRLVEQSALPVRRTLEQIGILKSTFYAWYAALPDRRPGGFGRPSAKAAYVSGTAFPMTCARKSSNSRWMSRN